MKGLVERGFLGLNDHGQISPQERCLRDLRLEGRVVFDIGAFEGAHTLFFATQVGAAGRVFTFEPHPDNRAQILAKLERAGLSNVDVRPIAVGGRRESREFVYPGDLSRGSADAQIKSKLLHEPHARRLIFEVSALDAEIAAGELPDPDFVKVDVEGLERDVLDGMRETARRCKPALFVELHGASTAQETDNYRSVLDWLFRHGYRVTHVESGRALRSTRKLHDLYAGQHLCCV